MKSATFQSIAALLKRLFERTDVTTEQFLKSRNARLIVQDANSQSFHAMRLAPAQDVHVLGRTLHLRLKYAENTVRVTLNDRTKKIVIADLTVPNDPDAGTLNLNFDDVRMKIEVDAEPAQP